MDKFLSFWSQHNTVIIEGLIALIILSSLFLAYRSFFAKSSRGANAENGEGFDATQLEKTLQKILENQGKSLGKASANKGASEDLEIDLDLDMDQESAKAKVASSPGATESPAEVSQLRLSLNESQQKVELLQKQLQEALALAEAKGGDAPAASGAAGDAGLSAKEKEELNGKIKDLEARLAEYEIISEDIADLSRYREENENLKKELEGLKAGGVATPAPASAPTPTTAPPVAEVESKPEPEVQEAAPAEVAPVEAPPVEVPSVEAPAAEEVVAAEAPAPAAESSDSNFIDDELMKEFAAAVEGQKSLSQAASKAGSGKDAAKATDKESDQLMSEFENFVTKKS